MRAWRYLAVVVGLGGSGYGILAIASVVLSRVSHGGNVFLVIVGLLSLGLGISVIIGALANREEIVYPPRS